MARQEQNSEFKEKVVQVSRVTKVVKGGRTFRFSVLVVIGDEKGRVGVGNGKAAEVPDAIRKAIEEAKRNLVTIKMVGTTIPHEIISEFGAGKVLLKPAKEGTGVIAGGSVRAVVELAGIKDIRTKCLGSRNARNVVYSTMKALKELRTYEDVKALRA